MCVHKDLFEIRRKDIIILCPDEEISYLSCLMLFLGCFKQGFESGMGVDSCGEGGPGPDHPLPCGAGRRVVRCPGPALGPPAPLWVNYLWG